MKKFIALSITAVILASCAADPKIVEVQQQGDTGLNCEQLSAQLQEAKGYKAAAREEDKFQLKYIWLPTGVMSAYRFNKAESSAQERINYLNSLASQKSCGAPAQFKNEGQIPELAPQGGNVNLPPRPRR